MALDPVRSPVDGTLLEALEVALAYQRLATVEHESWPVGVAWSTGGTGGTDDTGGTGAWVQWAHDQPGEGVPDGWLGLLEAGVASGVAATVAPDLAGLGFGLETQAFGDTRVFTWEADDEARGIGSDRALLDLLARTARACGAPEAASYDVYPDA